MIGVSLSQSVARDTIIENQDMVPEIIKIDAEGLDRKVLQGAKLALGKTDVIFCEVAVFYASLKTRLSLCVII